MTALGTAICSVLGTCWGFAHPAGGLLLAAGLAAAAVAAVRFCREIAPALAVASWGTPGTVRPRPGPRPAGGPGWEDR